MDSWSVWIYAAIWAVCAALTAGKSDTIQVNVIGGVPRSDLVCWTCPNHMDNESCNKWAPNLACPQNHTVCQTVHMFSTEKMESVSVEKRCVRPSACTEEHVGCELSDDGATKLCISCCDGQLCNEEVPTDMSSALELSSVFEESSASNTRLSSHQLILVTILSLLSLTGLS